MSKIFEAVSIFLVSLGALFVTYKEKALDLVKNQPRVSDLTILQSPSPIPTEAPLLTFTPKPVILPSNTSNPSISNQTSGINEYKYPNSQVISSGGNFLELKSSDDAEVITNWYEAKIKEKGFRAQSIAKTNANGNISNKIQAANDDIKVNIEISKKPESPDVSIKVEIIFPSL